MAANDPSFGVATPRGVLQGVAVFNWDGSQWQPQGKAATEVATPTGVLRGVASFTGGTPWAPTGRAGTEVPTPSGVLDGVAVYTWSGSQWTPPSGNIEVATPSGVLEGVAQFSWDGTAWQPAAQASSEVPTPYGVLTGIAPFTWDGSKWVAGGGPTLSLDFMRPGTLDPRITFTRASTATYTGASGVIQTAATNAPRWDYANGVLRGLLIEEARTNIVLNSGDMSNASWAKTGVTATAPVVTGNNVTAPDGTLTAARVVYPAVSGVGSLSNLSAFIAMTAVPYTFSVYLRGNVGGETLYIFTTPNGVLYYKTPVTLTTAWQRFVLVTPALNTASWFWTIGTDLRDTTQVSTPAQTIYAWGGQVELGASVTSVIYTAAASVTRAADHCTLTDAVLFGGTTDRTIAVSGFMRQAANVSGAHQYWVSLGDGTSNNYMNLISPGLTSVIRAQVQVAAVNKVNGGDTSYGAAPTAFKAALANGATWSGAVNGVTMGGSGGVSQQIGPLSLLHIGESEIASGMPNGWFQGVSIWNRALSQSELISVTT